MNQIKKIFTVAVVALVSFAPVFAKEDLNENLRVELNVADFGFFGVTAGNTTDIGVDITSKNNKLGGRVGVMVRESWLLGGDAKDVTVSWNPYIGFDFFNGCIMGGAIPFSNSDGTVSWAPYVGFNWDFDVLPVKNGLSNSMAIRVGTDWYFDVVKSDSAAVSVLGSLFSAIVPKVYVGLTYKLGYGMNVGKNAEEKSSVKNFPDVTGENGSNSAATE